MNDTAHVTLNDRLRAAAARASRYDGGDAAATQQKAAVQAKAAAKVDIVEQTGIELKIKDNPFYKAMTDPQATQDDKIQQVADALDVKKQPIEKAQENFKAFQEYYTYLQSQDLDEEIENIKRLIRELQGNSKVEVTNILKALNGMLNDVKECRGLVEVLRQSRVTGKTVEELTAAVKRNEDIVKRLGELDAKRKAAAATAAAAKAVVDARIAERDAESKKLLRRVMDVFKKDTTLDDRVAGAATMADGKGKALAEVDRQIAELNGERRKDLESGPLTILRSLDEADDDLSGRLISSGNKGIDTITGVQKSALQLMQRALFSEGEIDKISRRVADKQITFTVLKCGLTEASANTNEFKEGLETQSAKTEADLSQAKAGPATILEVAKKETDAINVRTSIGQVIDYQSRLNDTITEMNGAVAKNIVRQGETEAAKGVVQGTKKSITVLGRDTLNTVAGNLGGVLHNLVADQTDETQAAIVAFAHAAEDVKEGSLKDMMTRKHEMHDKDMSLLDDTIKRLNTSSDMIAKTLEMSVDDSVAVADKRKELAAATEQLETATTTMRTVVGKMSNDSVQGRSSPQQN
jgi:hypothetical protein